jgi:hypothetical protein
MTEEEQSLFRAMSKRHSNRRIFEDRQVPRRLLLVLQAAAREEGAWLHVAQEAGAKHAIADLIAEDDRIQLADNRFRRELVAWMHPNRSRDGIPGCARRLDQPSR